MPRSVLARATWVWRQLSSYFFTHRYGIGRRGGGPGGRGGGPGGERLTGRPGRRTGDGERLYDRARGDHRVESRRGDGERE